MTQRIETTIWELGTVLYDESVRAMGHGLEAELLSELALLDLLDRATLPTSLIACLRAPARRRWAHAAQAASMAAAV